MVNLLFLALFKISSSHVISFCQWNLNRSDMCPFWAETKKSVHDFPHSLPTFGNMYLVEMSINLDCWVIRITEHLPLPHHIYLHWRCAHGWNICVFVCLNLWDLEVVCYCSITEPILTILEATVGKTINKKEQIVTGKHCLEWESPKFGYCYQLMWWTWASQFIILENKGDGVPYFSVMFRRQSLWKLWQS